MSLEDAISKAESALSGKYNEWPATLEYVAVEDGSLKLAHVVQIRNEATSLWVEAFVDAHSGEVIHLTDFVNKASVSLQVLSKSNATDMYVVVLRAPRQQGVPDGRFCSLD